MRRSESVKATYEGVVRLPWSLAMISTLQEGENTERTVSLRVRERRRRTRENNDDRH